MKDEKGQREVEGVVNEEHLWPGNKVSHQSNEGGEQTATACLVGTAHLPFLPFSLPLSLQLSLSLHFLTFSIHVLCPQSQNILIYSSTILAGDSSLFFHIPFT